MPTATGVRITWTDLPDHVRTSVEEIVGGRVVEARSQPGGFSPGTADRVRTEDGGRAFVKAASPAQNPRTPALHRREAEVCAALPQDAAVPALLGVHDDGEWVALVLEDVDGRHPATPWDAGELTAVLDTLAGLAERTTPTPLPHLPSATEHLADNFAGWRRIAADRPADLDPWVAARTDRLADLSEQAVAALAGDTLLHIDVRSDNLLVRPDRTVALVDWPWACTGPAWLDRFMLLVNVNLYGGHDVEALLDRHLPDLDAEVATAVLAGVLGYFVDVARRPPPPGLPTLRLFQRQQGDATLAWLRRRLP